MGSIKVQRLSDNLFLYELRKNSFIKKDLIMKKFFRNKTVIITGHTGFKGSWLTLILIHLGAKVIGIQYYSYKTFLLQILKLRKELRIYVLILEI